MWPKSNEINDYAKYTNPNYILKQELEECEMKMNSDSDNNGNKTTFKFTM